MSLVRALPLVAVTVGIVGICVQIVIDTVKDMMGPLGD